jgi:uroporphyrinogen-III synthase
MSTVLVSPADSSQALVRTLDSAGARCLTWPALLIEPPDDTSPLGEAIENLFGYDWLILKNVRSAEYFLKALQQQRAPDALDTLRVVALGQSTSEKAAEFQVHVDIAFERFANAEIYDAVQSYVGDKGARLNILAPSANVIRESFEEQFAAGGARVDSIAAYRTTSDSIQLTKIKALLTGEAIDCAVFTSTAEFDELACVFDTDDLARFLRQVTIICADQSTAQAASDFGLRQTLVPAEPSMDEVANLIKSIQS